MLFLVFSVVIGAAAGRLLGGRIDRLADLRLRGAPLFAVALGLQVLAFPVGVFPWSTSDAVATALWLATYVVLVLVAVLNIRVIGFPIATAGMVSNIVAVIANGGHMPALPSALRDHGASFTGVMANSVADATPNLAWLVDRWALPRSLPLSNVFSVGDVLLGVGAAVIIAAAMGATLPDALRRRRDVPAPPVA